MEDPLERNLWELSAPLTRELPDHGARLFIYESGMRIGLGKVVGLKDDTILVEIEFTDQPRLGHLYYGTIPDAAGLEEGQ